METVGGIAIHIPEDRIKDFEFLVDNPSRLRELKLRSRYPAVQNAWEHYQLLVKLCGGDDDA